MTNSLSLNDYLEAEDSRRDWVSLGTIKINLAERQTRRDKKRGGKNIRRFSKEQPE